MEKMKKIAVRAGKVIAALAGCVLMPVLIWVALAVAIAHRVRTTQVEPALTPVKL